MNNTSEKQPTITVALPCYNEEITIAKVIGDFRRELPSAEIIVFDNASTDRTASISRENGVRVVYVKKRGKGNVMQHIFQYVDADILLVVDGDDTYEANDVHRLIRLIQEEDVDMAVGNRFSRTTRQGFSWSHRIGNVIFRVLLNVLFRTKYADILSGYRTMSREFYKNIPLLSTGFEVETELTLQALERGYSLREINITYRNRPINSHSKIREFQDGSKIVLTIVSLLRDYRPMAFFSYIGCFFLLLGFLSGSIIVTEYIQTGFIRRVPTAILSVALVLVGVNAFISGFILSAVNRRHQEMETMIKRITQNK